MLIDLQTGLPTLRTYEELNYLERDYLVHGLLRTVAPKSLIGKVLGLFSRSKRKSLTEGAYFALRRSDHVLEVRSSSRHIAHDREVTGLKACVFKALTPYEAAAKYRNIVGYVFEISDAKGTITPYAVESESNLRKWENAL